eukprot:360988-Chlamydomonas_euryale.AAC.9
MSPEGGPERVGGRLVEARFAHRHRTAPLRTAQAGRWQPATGSRQPATGLRHEGEMGERILILENCRGRMMRSRVLRARGEGRKGFWRGLVGTPAGLPAGPRTAPLRTERAPRPTAASRGGTPPRDAAAALRHCKAASPNARLHTCVHTRTAEPLPSRGSKPPLRRRDRRRHCRRHRREPDPSTPESLPLWGRRTAAVDPFSALASPPPPSHLPEGNETATRTDRSSNATASEGARRFNGLSGAAAAGAASAVRSGGGAGERRWGRLRNGRPRWFRRFGRRRRQAGQPAARGVRRRPGSSGEASNAGGVHPAGEGKGVGRLRARGRGMIRDYMCLEEKYLFTHPRAGRGGATGRCGRYVLGARRWVLKLWSTTAGAARLLLVKEEDCTG